MNLRMRNCVLSLATIGLLVGLTTGNAWNFAPANSVSGEAFGVSVNAAGVRVGPTPHVVLPSDGGMVSDQLLNITVPNVAASTTLGVVTTGSIGPNTASAQSSATVEQVNLLKGAVAAQLVVAMSNSTADGSTAKSTAEGSTLIGLSINGSTPVDVTPSPNTTIPIPGGAVILNEQILEGDGVHTSALTVNMIHVVINDPLTGTITGDIIVASAHSDVNFVPAPKAGNAFMTGGGKLGTGRDIATFGFNAGSRGAGGLHGQLQYIDHATGLKVHSLSIDSFGLIAEAPCVTFSGSARVNDADGYSFTVNRACDNGEPGVGHDTFDISVSGPGVSYSRSGTLTGGNLQLHPE
ncbi:MAG TPA: choice-of-anchor P family protein [Burkholderiales bacterium]|nr:choice-of-anchor P family protein [Burkholderiales bacterium]